MQNYVNIPDYIYKKFKEGKITPPHFSDYIRCCLLDKYGGLWLDASLYMLDKVPSFITKQNFFILSHQNKKDISKLSDMVKGDKNLNGYFEFTLLAGKYR